MFSEIVKFIRKIYGTEDFIPLHAPVFRGNEKKYLEECIDSTFVSYVGRFVTLFEDKIKDFTGSGHVVATVNGTTALHIALLLEEVKPGDEILTQALTFVATANAISYTGAKPFFIDSEKETLGMSVEKLEEFLSVNTYMGDDGFTYSRLTGSRIPVCIPMHTFGHPVKIEKIAEICAKHNITVIEDAAESLGSYYKSKHTGTFGRSAILSFNGNKIITTGGGGMIITDDKQLADKAKHMTTTAKAAHPWEFIHDETGFNYRLTNVNAAIGCAQMEMLPEYMENKRNLAELYREFFATINIPFMTEQENCRSNYWLNSIFLKDRGEREKFLEYTNKQGVMTRPAWRLMNKLEMYKTCGSTNLDNAEWIEDRLVNIPSSVRL